MLQTKDNRQLIRLLFAALWIILTALVLMRIFWRLDAAPAENTDEAWYGVNTCEMFESGDWIIPTMRHEIDYGSKPPLQLWLILLFYTILGPGDLALRLPAACATLLLFILISAHLVRRYGTRTAVLFAAAFPVIWRCFYLHGFRSGDMDGLFCLFFAIAVIALREAAEGSSASLIVYGLSIALGFLTKSMHAGLFFLIGLLYLPILWKKLRPKTVWSSFAAAVTPPIIWLLLLLRRENGLTLFYTLTIGEFANKVGGDTSSALPRYLADLGREKIIWLLVLLSLIRALLSVLRRGSGPDAAPLHRRFGSWCREHLLLLLALFVPLAVYGLFGSYMAWYIYPTYVSAAVLAAVLAGECVSLLAGSGEDGEHRGSRAAAAVFFCCVTVACAAYTANQLYDYRLLGTGGNLTDALRGDLMDYQAQNGDIYRGKHAYFALDRQRNYGDRGHWQLEDLFYGYAITGFDCRDGGVEAFLEDEDSLIILDGDLWDEYAGVLTGHVFLEMNTFYVMNHDWY
ncbi:MAG: glycosyltransferase family 39 protein [Lachnospiraceae bacterium]|nr:glycosyltransferase family 39 protein [Lachnospiraceae bacterium]